MRCKIILLCLLSCSACTSPYDMKIYRPDGSVQTIRTEYEGDTPVHSVCKETARDEFGRTLECRERPLD